MKVYTWYTKCLLLTVAWALGTWFLTFPLGAHAQGNNCPPPAQGNNAVYNTTCNSQGPAIVGSPAFIDAGVFASQASDFCGVIYVIISSNTIYPGAGAVIDARGLPGNTGISMTCATGTTPWNNGAAYVNKPSTILLPAQTVYIPATWILPNGTRVIGEGSTNPYDAITAVPQTTIQASSSLTGAMIQFGDSSCPSPGGCLGVTLEDVTLNGSNLGINGIVNSNSQELSYAKNVTDRFARPGPRIVRLKLGNGGTNRDFRDLLRNRTGDGREDVICV
jgi:hypothetical protein